MTPGTPAGALAARSLRVSFADRQAGAIHALDGVSAAFPPGRLTAIVGPSGSGKSTLLHALAGIVVPQEGEVASGDTVVNRLDERGRDAWRLAHCGMVFQDFRLIDELDALGNTLLPAQFRCARLPASVRARADDLLARFEVPRRAGPVGRLSRGEQQRVALARALLLDPPLILADEPTASLDAKSGQGIAQALRDLAQSGKTVVAVTHDHKLMALADQVLTLRAGCVVQGTTGEAVR